MEASAVAANLSRALNLENDKFEAITKPNACEFYEAVPTLQKIAPFKVAVDIWRYAIGLENPSAPLPYNAETDSYVLFSEKDTLEIVDKLQQNFPEYPFIREVLVDCLDVVKNEMIRWANYYRKNIFIEKGKKTWALVKLSDLLFCEWLPCGKIDDRKTALKMLSNARLTEVDTFKIMCKYCLEDSIKELKPGSLPKRSLKKIRFDKNPLMYYWLCHINDELHKIPKKEDESIESFLITADDVDNWPAIEFFWDRLSAEEQLTKAEELLDRRPEFQKELFFKMNEFQRDTILSKKPLEIMRNFFFLPSCERYVFSIWTSLVRTITYEKFAQVFLDLLNASLPDHVERLRCLVEMWHSSPLNLKTLALESIAENVVLSHIKDYCPEGQQARTLLPCYPDFLLAFLSSASIEFRKNILFKHGDKLITHNDSHMIDQLMELCLADDNDIAEFRKYLSDSEIVQKYCCMMLVEYSEYYDHDRLSGFVNYYLPDPQIKANLMVNLVPRAGSLINFFNCAIGFINDRLNISSEETIELKKRMIWLYATHHHQFRWVSYYAREFVTDIVTKVLDAEELKKYKSTALETFRSSYKWCNFDEESIRGFLQWCFDQDTEKISKFKKSLSMDSVFDYFFSSERDRRFPSTDSEDEGVAWDGEAHFDLLHRILLWYYEDPVKVKKYKQVKAIELHLKRRNQVHGFLLWCLEYDQAEINNFIQFASFRRRQLYE
ncbi:uncharacterized protein LOC135845723 [Planococcus citri]|uniref:uncharacterized protein LOC135845723 n=1 Tax=Planococcus citri TaxID=170843 RepID=UPI0031F90813